MNIFVHMGSALMLAAIPASSWGAPAAPVQSYDEYRSWLVACDNGLSCIAKGFDDGSSRAELTIEREAGPNGAATATIATESAFTARDLAIDGKPLALDMSAWTLTTEDGDGSTLTTDDPAAIRALVARLRVGAMLSAGGAEIPLDGITAALLRMDDRQGRVGGVTALIRPGPRPAGDVPAPPAIPRIARRPIAARLSAGEADRLIARVRTEQAALFEKEGCQEMPGAMTAEANALNDMQAIVFVPCIMGAYQGSSLAFIVPRGKGASRQLILPTPYLGADAESANLSYFTEAWFDAEGGTISTAAKGRGLADCGTSASWIWDGAAFRLTSLDLQRNCGGRYPGDWPSLFRSVQ